MLEKATDGRLILETKVGLFPPTEVIHGVIGGRADIGFQRIPWVSGTFPLWDFGELPFFFGNVYEYESALNNPRMVEILQKTHAEVGLVKVMEPAVGALDALYANQAIATVDDFKGLKIRSAGLLPTLALELLGASPLTIGTTEIAEALQRGTVDVCATTRGFGLGLGMADVTTYVNYWAVSSAFGNTVMVNMDSWNALPADLQQIVMDLGAEMQGQIIYAATVEDYFAALGIRVGGLEEVVPEKAEIDKARELAKPVIDKWLELAGPYGPEVLAIAGKFASGAEIMLK